MRNRSVLAFIKHYWYLSILCVILIVVLVIGTQKEKPWSTDFDTTKTNSSVIKDKSASVESEASPAESEDSDDASRIESDLFFLSDHQKENEASGSEESELETAGSEAVEIKEIEDPAEITSEEIDEGDDPVNYYNRTEPNKTNSYTPTYSNDSYSKPKNSNSATENKSTTTTAKQPAKTPVVEPEEPKESAPVVESKPIEIPAVEDPESTESEQPAESAAPEVIESEKPIEENVSTDPPLIEE